MDNENMNTEDEEILFNQYDVILSKVPGSHISELNISGVIFIHKSRTSAYILEWKVHDNLEIQDEVESQEDWSFVNQIVYKPAFDSIAVLSPKSKSYRIALSKIKKIKVVKNEIKLFDYNDDNFTSCIFQKSHPNSFLRALEGQGVLKQSINDKNTYITQDPDREKLQRSFAELNIDEIRNSKERSRNWTSHGYDFLQNVSTILVGNRDNHFYDKDLRRNNVAGTSNRIEQEAEFVVHNKNITDDDKFTNSGEQISIDLILPERQTCERENPLSSKQWNEFQTTDGRISDPDRIKEIIFRGGIEQSIRSDVWKYLLEYNFWENTTSETSQRQNQLKTEYFLMKAQWQTLSETQEKNFSGYRDRKCQVEKDVKRTDRTHEYFFGDDNPNLDKLQDILLTYIMFNFDVGYVQGMSDLLSPILCLMEDEAASFWTFVAFMKKVLRNFDEDQAGMKNQLSNLRTLLDFANPKLFKYFKEHDSDNMYFCFRWLLVWFKREFIATDILELWEVLWTNLPCQNFHLFVAVAILDNEMNCIIDNEYGFTEILKHINELSERMNLKEVLRNAESIYHQVKTAKNLTDKVRVIIGEEPLNQPIMLNSTDSEIKISVMTRSDEEELDKLEENYEVSMNMNF